jgi:hypothetical protein
LEQNPTKLRIQEFLKDVIMDSYNGDFIRIWNTGEASNLINIHKSMKQDYLLSLFLFNICIDPIFTFIKRDENHEFAYSTEELSINLIQAYAGDVILISNSAEGLQSLINDADKIFTFLNIKLNPNKCETFKINNKKKEDLITIGGERKEFIQAADFIKYLVIPSGSERIAKKKFVEAKMQKKFTS